MPSVDNLPGVPEFLRAFRGELSARDGYADTHTGANYDIWGGVAAVLFSREVRRTRDIFRANYFDYARGADLNEIIAERFRDSRRSDGPGSGTAIITRSSAASGAGTIWQGTRVEAAIPNGAIRTYLVTSNVSVGATDTAIWVPVTSVDVGTTATVDAAPSGGMMLRFADPLWDNSWSIQRLICAPGDVGESEEEAKARIRQHRLDSRVGYPKYIVQACKDAGASNVVLFGSDFLDTPPSSSPIIGSLSSGYGDVGLNRVFVGDTGYASNHSLLVKCRRAIASSAVLGTATHVWGMTPVSFTCSVTAQLWDDPGNFDQDGVKAEIANAIANYFSSSANAYYFRYVAIQGAVMRSVRAVQTLSFTSGPAEPNLLTFLNTAALSHYTAVTGDIRITLTGP